MGRKCEGKSVSGKGKSERKGPGAGKRSESSETCREACVAGVRGAGTTGGGSSRWTAHGPQQFSGVYLMCRGDIVRVLSREVILFPSLKLILATVG